MTFILGQSAPLLAVQKHVGHAAKTDFDLETEVIPKRTAS